MDFSPLLNREDNHHASRKALPNWRQHNHQRAMSQGLNWLLLLLATMMATGCAGVGTSTPKSGPIPTTASSAAASGVGTASAQASSATYSVQWSVESVERIALDKPEVGSGNSWLLIKTKITNPGTKSVTIKEQQAKLTVDGQTISADKAAIDAAEKQNKGKGFGDVLGTSIKATESDSRISVFKVPTTGKQFMLQLTEEKSATAIAAPIAVTSEAVAALGTPNSATAPTTVAASTPAAVSTSKPTNAPPTPTTGPQAYGLNTLVSVKNWDMAVARVEQPGKELVWSQFGNKSVAAGTWVVVVFDMKNTGKTNFGVNTSDLELRAANNITYKVSDDFGTYSYSEYKGGQAIGGQVPPGVNVTYHIVFDIAPGTTGLQLVFKQDTKPVFALDQATAGAAAATPTSKPSSPPVPPAVAGQVYALNTLVSVKNWDVAVAGVETPGKELVWSKFGNKSTAAGTWLIVAFDMKNTGNTNFGVNTFDFELRAANGVTYKVSDDVATYSYSDYKGGQSIGGQVPPGVSVTYYVVFDIAPGTTGLQFVFKQDIKPAFNLGQ